MLSTVFISCSRQVTSLNASSKLQVASALEKTSRTEPIASKLPENKVQAVSVSVMVQAPQTPLAQTTAPQARKTIAAVAFAKKEVKKIENILVNKYPGTDLGSKTTVDHDYPQINKAGFILIGAGILAYILHLILIACIALLVIGLIILLSPLFHKRY